MPVEPSQPRLLNRNLIVLFCAQCLALSAVPAMVLLGGLVGADLSPNPAWTTLPVAASIVGTAAGTIPAALIMARFGRRLGFSGAVFVGGLSALGAAISLNLANFWLFTASLFLTGFCVAFIQQFRFAAAESVSIEQAGKAISVLMLSGIVAAWLGPEVAQRGAQFGSLVTYTGSFLAVAGLMFVGSLVLLFGYQNSLAAKPDKQQDSTALTTLLTAPLVLAIVGGMTAYSVMSLIMTATPLQLHHSMGHSLEETAFVIQSHIMAMYLPSLFSGHLVARFGARLVMAMGWMGFAISLAVALSDIGYQQIWIALVLLGISWNLLFVGSTTLLAQSSPTPSRFRIQAVNEFSVFTAQAFAALGSGWVVRELGWSAVQWVATPMLACAALLLIGQRLLPRRPH